MPSGAVRASRTRLATRGLATAIAAMGSTLACSHSRPLTWPLPRALIYPVANAEQCPPFFLHLSVAIVPSL
eukprot:844912-Alexandrium_andersonii.AAC.1